MGTAYSVSLAELPAGRSVDDMAAAIRAELDAVDSAMSGWRTDSELSRFNAQHTTGWFGVSAPLAGLVARAQEIAARSDGAFDITAAALVDAWGFGPARVGRQPPPANSLTEARRHVGFRLLQVRRQPPALRKRDPSLRIDLSAIAKGYAVDRIASLLDRSGLQNYLAEIGGELRSRGHAPGGRPWRIGVERPDSGGRAVERVLRLQGRVAVATSGDYRNFFIAGGRRYSHLIDPRSGKPADNGLASVTVLGNNCADSDAFATALFVLGPADGYRLAQQLGLAALFIIREHGRLVEKSTPAFDRRLRN